MQKLFCMVSIKSWEFHSGILKSFKAIQVEESLKVFEIISVCLRKSSNDFGNQRLKDTHFQYLCFFMVLSRIFFNFFFFHPNYDFILNSALVKRIKCRSGYNVGKKKVVEKWEWNYIWAELPHSFPSKINQDAPFKINQEKLSVNGD